MLSSVENDLAKAYRRWTEKKITRVYMKWVPLLVTSGGTGISAELVVAFAVTIT